MNTNMNTNIKNITRIASTLGTWTGQTHLKTDIGSYELLAYFVIHFMPDPMRGYGCSLEGCIEQHNQICEVGNTDADGVDGYTQSCNDIAGNIIDWSDVTAFMYFGARIDVGFPFNKHRAEDTGGWVGPFNIIMANGDIPPNNDNDNDNDPAKPKVVDRYVSRYVKSPLTQYLKMPQNCSLLGEDDFNKVAGPIAVDSTTQGQYDPNRSDDDSSDDYDPYQKYLGTCDNGDVKPYLPLFEFDFEQSQSTDVNGTETLQENIQVKVNYKFLTMPNKSDFMYKLWPMVQRRFNKANMGFHVSGPYCYGDDPGRGYTFDMNFDTRDPKAMLKLNHGCVEGLPCTPPAAELYNLQRGGGGGSSGGGGDNPPDSNGGNIPIIPDDGGSTVDVGQTLFFLMAIILLSAMLLCSCCLNCRYRRRLKVVTSTIDGVDEPTYQRLGDVNDENDGDGREEDVGNDATNVQGGEQQDTADVTATTPLIEKAEEEGTEIV